MTLASARWADVCRLFDGALARAPIERSAFLDAACDGDLALRAEVTSLVAVDAAPMPPILDVSPGEVAVALAASLADDIRRADVVDTLGARLQTELGHRYRVERELGGGGMSRVFLAEDTRLGRRVVIKMLAPDRGSSVDVERFRREMRIVAALRHPNIVSLLETGEPADGLVYYSMPYIAGESLARRLARDGRLAPSDAIQLLDDVADALAHAHRRGVIHCDVKPGNILIDGDHALVADFGIATARGASARAVARLLDASGGASGTPAYMSPEQARGDAALDPRSDVYALGCVAFEVLTGTRPFADRHRAARAWEWDVAPPAASARCAGLSLTLDAVIARALAPARADRYARTTEFAAACRSALAPPTRADVPRRQLQHRRATIPARVRSAPQPAG